MSDVAPQGEGEAVSAGNAGNALNFDWPAKSPNHDFQLSALRHALKRFANFLYERNLLLNSLPIEEWADSIWTEEYWPKIRTELELIWSKLPESPLDLYSNGEEGCFEQLEELLSDVKFRWFENITHIPRCTLDINLVRQFGHHRDVMARMPEPDNEHQTGNKKVDNQKITPSFANVDFTGLPDNIRREIDENEQATANDPFSQEVARIGDSDAPDGPKLIVRFLEHGTYGNRSCDPGEVWPVEKERALYLLLHVPPTVELATPEELKRDRVIIKEVETCRKRWNLLNGNQSGPFRLIVRFVRAGKNSYGDNCDPGEVWEVEEEHAYGLLRGKTPIGELATEAELKAYIAKLAAGSKAEEKPDKRATGCDSKGVKPKKARTWSKTELLIIAAITNHHNYAKDSCLNIEPISVTKLARLLNKSKSTVSDFFRRAFVNPDDDGGKASGHENYTIQCAETNTLIAALKMLNNEYRPYVLLKGETKQPNRSDADRD